MLFYRITQKYFKIPGGVWVFKYSALGIDHTPQKHANGGKTQVYQLWLIEKAHWRRLFLLEKSRNQSYFFYGKLLSNKKSLQKLHIIQHMSFGGWFFLPKMTFFPGEKFIGNDFLKNKENFMEEITRNVHRWLSFLWLKYSRKMILIENVIEVHRQFPTQNSSAMTLPF